MSAISEHIQARRNAEWDAEWEAHAKKRRDALSEQQELIRRSDCYDQMLDTLYQITTATGFPADTLRQLARDAIQKTTKGNQ